MNIGYKLVKNCMAATAEKAPYLGMAIPVGSLALYAKDGASKVADIVVSETDGGQQLFCHLSDAAAVPKGTYKVRIASHGLDPTDPLTVATLTVTLVEAIPEPEPFKITDVRTDGEGGESGRIADGQDFAIVGSGFWESIGSSMDKTKKATFYVTESDPSTGEIVRRTNSFDAFVVGA